ncbi:MAG: DEAD/DEAH box helicase family protein, partial [Helicobacter sp.]|nr:DEAD/DEAH box helicase family protein [Helicobacter sp.]
PKRRNRWLRKIVAKQQATCASLYGNRCGQNYDTFDFIIIDGCHRSIYGQWRQVLEYFDT